jgi:hypothetical protein
VTSINLIDEGITVHFEMAFEIHEIGVRKELERLRIQVLEQAAEIERLNRKLIKKKKKGYPSDYKGR